MLNPATFLLQELELRLVLNHDVVEGIHLHAFYYLMDVVVDVNFEFFGLLPR